MVTVVDTLPWSVLTF